MTRIGASQAFFNIVAQFNAEKLITDARSLRTVMKAVELDTYEAMLKPFEDFNTAINAGIDLVKELSVELGQAGVEFEKFFGSEDIDDTRDSIIQLGQAYNQTFSDALAAGSRAAQVANLIGRENVDILTEQGMILAEISDLTTEEAQKGIIKLQQQTGVLFGKRSQAEFEQLGLLQQRAVLLDGSAFALNALNTIANRSVALEGDLVQTMTNFAAQGKLAGDSFEFMAAASAVMLEAGEEAGTAGRALRMTYARLGGNINGTADKLEAMGFQLRQENGEMKKMQDILQELSDKGFANLSGQQKQNIAQIIAGNRHYVRFIKLMENFDRATELAADGLAGFDDAGEQAEKALNDVSNQLEIQEKRLETYQAAVGRGLGEFMVGEAKRKADFMQVVHAIQESTGALGEMAGRIKATLEMTGGFIKMGIAIRSLGIGMEIMDSVQRSMMNVEIANRTLHSKQADYYEGRRDLTEHEKAGLQVIQQKTQAVNYHMEQQNLLKKMALPLQRDLKAIVQERAEIEERALERGERMEAAAVERLAAQKALMNLEAAGESITAKRDAQHQYMLDKGIDSRKAFLDVMNDESATQRAMTSQLQSHIEFAKSIRGEDRKRLHANHKLNRVMHDGLQMMASANMVGRAIRHQEGEAVKVSIRKILADKEMTAEMQDQLKIMDKSFERQMKSAEAGSEQEKHFDNMLKTTKKLHTALKTGTFKTGIGEDLFSGKDFKNFEKIMKDYQGRYIQTSQVIDLMNMAMLDSGELHKRLSAAQAVEAELHKEGIPDRERIVELMKDDVELTTKLTPLIDEMTAAETNAADAAAKKAEAIRISQGVQADTEGIIDKQLNREHKLTMAKDQAAQAQANFNSHLGTGASLLGGIIGGTNGATLSLVGMTSQLLLVSTTLYGATKNLAITKYEAHATAMGLDAMNMSAHRTTLVMKTLGSVLKMAIPLALITAVFSEMAKGAQRADQMLAKLEDRFMSLSSAQQSILSEGSGQRTLFEGNQALANMLGLDDISMKELSENSDLVSSYLKTIQDASLELDDVAGAGLADITATLETLEAILGKKSYADENLMNSYADDIDELMSSTKGAKGFFGKIGAYLTPFEAHASESELKAADRYIESMKEAGKIRNSFVDDLTGSGGGYQIRRGGSSGLKAIIEETVDAIQDGNALTEQELEDFAKMGSGKYFKGVVSIIENMNDLVITGDEATLMFENLKLEIEDTLGEDGELGTATESIKNLTDELTNFTNAREELFFGGQYGNITGSLYEQVVSQGVGVLYNKQEVIVSNVFHGFFNEQEAGERIGRIVEDKIRAISG